MGARTKARKAALDILFESELRGLTSGASLESRLAADPAAVRPYTADLVRGVAAHLAEIDATISRHAHGWTLDRMPAVDRNLLRIAIFELGYGTEPVPAAVVINEAVTLATELSTDASASFVNGLLAAVIAERPAGRPA
jgi:transcription antitermination protein NusB